jgi:ABC-type lipoprotein release transport system permease subunit
MVCTAILTGALLVGDSVRAGLRRIAGLRLGRIQYSLLAEEHPFGEGLAGRLHKRTGYEIAAVLMTDGLLERPDGTLRINRVRILGVDEAFFALSSDPAQFDANKTLAGPNRVGVNEALWQRLGGQAGDLILRLDDPSALSRDLIFASETQARTTLRIRVETVVPDAALGRFGLQADQQAPLNVFVPRTWLAGQLGLEGKANLLVAAAPKTCPSSPEQLDRALGGVAELEDYGLSLVEPADTGMIELQSGRLFIPEVAATAALAQGHTPIGLFTYFVNGLSHGGHTTPYSMVAAIGAEDDGGVFETLADDEMMIGEWLADDVGAEAGDTITMDYFGISATNTLVEKQAAFRVRQVVPMLGFAADATLMPPFPGLEDAENCQDWDPAIPVELSRIRDKDEAYWDRYRGTPKAFISLRAGQTLWQNRFGSLTAVRWPKADNTIETLRKPLTDALDPAAFGLFFDDVAARAEQARAGSTDFGGLFAGLSMFLILACAVILAMIFVFTLEQRSAQAGILLAMGWPKRRIYRLLLAEGALLALVGAVAGAGLGVVYTAAMMQALRTIWQDAVAGAALQFHAAPATLAIGAGAGFVVAVGAMGTGLLRRLKKTPVELLSNTPRTAVGRFSRGGRIIRWSLLAVCLMVFAASFYGQGTGLSEESFFFLNGSLMLLVFVLAAIELMQAAGQLRRPPSSPVRLVVKNMIRRPGRSLAVMLTVACGVFMVLGVGLNRKTPARHTERESGTGGFALWVETAMPLAKAPDAAFGNELARQAGVAGAVGFVPLRQRRGDDASCLNLNRAQTPTLLGVEPEAFAKRGAFTFRAAEAAGPSPWTLLSNFIDDETIPAVGDYATVHWGLGLDLGDTLTMQDDRGREFRLKIVGILKESVFQGRLIISEKDFIERFASVSGYPVLLVDAEPAQAQALAGVLSRQLADSGAEVAATETILRDFLRVENTYLAIFLALGGLGLILGSAGAGLVLLFNVMDRRGELAMMQAMGFSIATLRRLLLAEHAALFAAGVLAGSLSAMFAVLPSVLEAQTGALATGLLLPTVIFVSGLVFVTLAARAATQRDLLENLRNE